MTIATKEEYEQKKNELMNNGGIFMVMYSQLLTMPCAIYDSDSKKVNQQCLDSIWKNKDFGIGCDKPSPYTAANQANKTYGQIVQDAYKLAKEKPGDCYTDSNRQLYRSIPSIANINFMGAYKEKSFAKNNNPILNMTSEDMCASNCSSQSNCVSATYNSDSKKCWLNIGTYADWKPPVDGSANDVAFVNGLYKILYNLESLNNELHEYEVKNNISKPVIPSTGNLNKFVNDIPGKVYKFLSNKELPVGETKIDVDEDADVTTSFDDIFNDDTVDPKEVDLLKKQFHDLNADRIATAKLLKGYKKQISEMSEKQEDSNEALKKQIITISLIVVIGILLIFLLSAIIQSFNSNSNNSFSGGGLRTLGSTARTLGSTVRTLGSKFFRKK